MRARPDQHAPARHEKSKHGFDDTRADGIGFDQRCVRYIEYIVALHGALIFGTPNLGAAIDRFARDAPLVCGKASWGYDADAGRGWFQLAADATEQDYETGAAAFDYDMRQRGLTAITPRFLR